jgi:hypothetical protein
MKLMSVSSNTGIHVSFSNIDNELSSKNKKNASFSFKKAVEEERSVEKMIRTEVFTFAVMLLGEFNHKFILIFILKLIKMIIR